MKHPQVVYWKSPYCILCASLWNSKDTLFSRIFKKESRGWRGIEGARDVFSVATWKVTQNLGKLFFYPSRCFYRRNRDSFQILFLKKKKKILSLMGWKSLNYRLTLMARSRISSPAYASYPSVEKFCYVVLLSIVWEWIPIVEIKW